MASVHEDPGVLAPGVVVLEASHCAERRPTVVVNADNVESDCGQLCQWECNQRPVVIVVNPVEAVMADHPQVCLGVGDLSRALSNGSLGL